MKTQADLIAEIIDGKLGYTITRRPYNEDFAKAHGITLADIEEKRFIPCLECGSDITPKILLGKFKNKMPVYCGPECRAAHARYRIMKFHDRMDINAVAKSLVARCLTITPGEHIRRPRGKGKLTLVALMTETNALLRDILQELRK
jgi:hypothetical protein